APQLEAKLLVRDPKRAEVEDCPTNHHQRQQDSQDAHNELLHSPSDLAMTIAFSMTETVSGSSLYGPSVLMSSRAAQQPSCASSPQAISPPSKRQRKSIST